MLIYAIVFAIVMVKSKNNQKLEASFNNVGIRADHTDISKTWERFGYTEIRCRNTNALGEMVDPSGIKIIVQTRKKTKEPFVRHWLPAGQPFIPEEAIDEVVNLFEKRMQDTFPEAKENNFKIETITKKRSSKGNTQHWIVQTNKLGKVPNSHVQDDRLKLGFAIRNGYNTGVVLGVDIFTMRLVCSNGAVVRGADLAQTAIRHVGKDPRTLLDTLHDGLLTAMNAWTQVMSEYENMAKIKLNERMAKFLVEENKWIPKKYFPEYYNIPSAEDVKKKQVVTLTNEGKSLTLWQNFNDITQKLWHAQFPHTEKDDNDKEIKKEGINFKGIANKEKILHESMRAIINNAGAFA